jgi:hypothetical protein
MEHRVSASIPAWKSTNLARAGPKGGGHRENDDNHRKSVPGDLSDDVALLLFRGFLPVLVQVGAEPDQQIFDLVKKVLCPRLRNSLPVV